ncbi:hypothetical protein ATO6_07850 [Oceanicola sp. 22II-s10i]|nr:hypothetical protein ATO6_07850 [Oceanicola sp. 22II-s10i]
MMGRVNKDTVGGLVLLAVGAWFAIYAAMHYPLGSLRRMGPGMFPMGMGIAVAGLGLLVALQSLLREVEKADIRFWSPLFVLSGIAGFAILMPLFGLIPALLAVTIISSLAELKLRPVSLALLCLGLSLLAPFVFRICLGLQMAMFNWPF